MKQVRNFIFTCNNYTDLSIDKIKALPEAFKCNYYIYGKEKGKEGTSHLQGYVELSSRVQFTKIRKYLNGFHIEERKGTAEQCIEYCSKENDTTVYGTPKCPGKRSDLATLKKMLQEGSSIKMIMEDESLKINYQSLRFAEKLQQYYDKPRDYKPTVTWYYGASGSGKTSRAVKSLPDAYFKSTGSRQWWPGYDGQENIIIDDVDNFSVDFQYLLGLIDRYPFVVETKGGSRQFRGRNIIITSLQKPELTYYTKHGDTIYQLLRRIDNLEEVHKSEE